MNNEVIKGSVLGVVACVVVGAVVLSLSYLEYIHRGSVPHPEVDAPLKTFIVLLEQDGSLLRRAEPPQELRIKAHYWLKKQPKGYTIWTEVEFYQYGNPDPVAGFPREAVAGWYEESGSPYTEPKGTPLSFSTIETEESAITDKVMSAGGDFDLLPWAVQNERVATVIIEHNGPTCRDPKGHRWFSDAAVVDSVGRTHLDCCVQEGCVGCGPATNTNSKPYESKDQ